MEPSIFCLGVEQVRGLCCLNMFLFFVLLVVVNGPRETVQPVCEALRSQCIIPPPHHPFTSIRNVPPANSYQWQGCLQARTNCPCDSTSQAATAGNHAASSWLHSDYRRRLESPNVPDVGSNPKRGVSLPGAGLLIWLLPIRWWWW